MFLQKYFWIKYWNLLSSLSFFAACLGYFYYDIEIFNVIRWYITKAILLFYKLTATFGVKRRHGVQQCGDYKESRDDGTHRTRDGRQCGSLTAGNGHTWLCCSSKSHFHLKLFPFLRLTTIFFFLLNLQLFFLRYLNSLFFLFDIFPLFFNKYRCRKKIS